MNGKRGQPPKATADQWSRMALSAIARSGLAGVSIEALARELHVTKGSFYGYFANREELIAAALDLWVSDHDEHMLAPLRAIADPVERFAVMGQSTLLRSRHGPQDQRPSTISEISQVELSLLADRDHPAVKRTLALMAAKRVEFLTECLIEIGHPQGTARQMAISAYTLSLGTEVLRRISPTLSAGIDADYMRALIAPYITPEETSADSAG